MRELRLRKARAAARELLESVGLARVNPVPVEDIAQSLGIRIMRGGLDGALAWFTSNGKSSQIRVSDRHDHAGQVRFSIAHELGHFVLDHGSATGCQPGDIQRFFGDAAQEEEANVFAGELLMPEPLVRPHCEVSPVSLDIVRTIAEEFGTSPVATAIRFAELTSERCAAVMSRKRQVSWAVRSPTFWPAIQRGQPTQPWSLAHGYFRCGEVPAEPQPVDAAAWVDSCDLPRSDAEIFEHAMPLPQLDAVLSLVWIPESCRSLAWRDH